MARCVMLSACPVSPALAGLLREDDFIIACDAGYRNCAPLHCKPHVIVGDFDTAPCPQQEDDEIVVLPHVKDDTDTEYAAKLAVQKGFVSNEYAEGSDCITVSTREGALVIVETVAD